MLDNIEEQQRSGVNGFPVTPYPLSSSFPWQGFYNEVANVLLANVDFHYPENTVNSVTDSHFKQLFNGSEIVVAGRLNDIEMNDFPIEVSAQLVRDVKLLRRITL